MGICFFILYRRLRTYLYDEGAFQTNLVYDDDDDDDVVGHYGIKMWLVCHFWIQICVVGHCGIKM